MKTLTSEVTRCVNFSPPRTSALHAFSSAKQLIGQGPGPIYDLLRNQQGLRAPLRVPTLVRARLQFATEALLPLQSRQNLSKVKSPIDEWIAWKWYWKDKEDIGRTARVANAKLASKCHILLRLLPATRLNLDAALIPSCNHATTPAFLSLRIAKAARVPRLRYVTVFRRVYPIYTDMTCVSDHRRSSRHSSEKQIL